MSDRGFTFIEVLFALFITAMVSMAVGGTVVLALRGEADSMIQREQVFTVASLQAAYFLEDTDRLETWTHESLVTGQAPTQTVWRLYRVGSVRAAFLEEP